MTMPNLKKQIQESWKIIPAGWERQVQNVYVSYYQMRQNKINQNGRQQHWKQYLDSDISSTDEEKE